MDTNDANGRNARFWADHFAEVDKANRDAIGAHHKAGHTVAELITALVGERDEAREHLDKVRQALRTPDGWATKMHALRVRQQRDEAQAQLASRPAIPADAEEGFRVGIGAWLGVERLSDLTKQDIVRGAAGAAMGVLEGFAPVSGSDTTANGGDR